MFALLQWITDSGIAAICADNYAVEAYPAREKTGPRAMLPLHHHCLFKLGLPLAELWYLKDLADFLHANGRHHFMLTAPAAAPAARDRFPGHPDRYRLGCAKPPKGGFFVKPSKRDGGCETVDP